MIRPARPRLNTAWTCRLPPPRRPLSAATPRARS